MNIVRKSNRHLEGLTIGTVFSQNDDLCMIIRVDDNLIYVLDLDTGEAVPIASSEQYTELHPKAEIHV